MTTGTAGKPTMSRRYLAGLSHPKQRAFLEAYVQAIIEGANDPITRASREAGIWRGTPPRWWNTDGRYARAFLRAHKIAHAVRDEVIARQVWSSAVARGCWLPPEDELG